jgi:exodeoxyribonuclease V alpha subunit
MNPEIITLKGAIERVTYHNPENGFCVLKVALKHKKNLATVIGNSAQVMAGEDIEAIGIWVYDKIHGYQFKSHKINMTIPTSLEGIKKYLASGLIKGIGKHFAEILVTAFKEDVFHILDNEPKKVYGLPGIGQKRTAQIVQAWSEQKIIREIMIFLHQHGIGTARAVRIYKTYGDNTIIKLQTNPYSLALDVWGIGFKTADQLAQSLGIDKNSVIRAEAGIRHILNEYSTQGHCAITPTELISQCNKMLEIEVPIITEAINNELYNKNIIQDVIDDGTYLYLAPLYYAEQGIANSIMRLINSPNQIFLDDERILLLAQDANIKLSPSQKEAILTSIKNKVSIITGGPGVGKTTIVRNILKILRKLNKNIILCAPTGRAAKRLTETSGFTAKTIHRLLEYMPGAGSKYNLENPLKVDFLIIDETSMVDVSLMNILLKSVPNNSGIMFVGDVDQLPSVGPGSVLGDMLNSQVIATTKLTEVFRQAQTSKIITNAHRINRGQFPQYENKPNDDFFFIELDEPEEIIQRIISIIADKLPKLYGVDPLADIQVLAPMNRGTLGVRNLNLLLQNHLNHNKSSGISVQGINFYMGDKIIQTVNNYNKDVFNGDIGYISKIDPNENQIIIKFDDRLVEYEKSELDEIDLAYATTIHKSQGSEYPVIIIPIATQHFTMLERNLLYTGVTRGRKLVILIGQKKALYLAVKQLSAKKRITSLEQKLRFGAKMPISAKS